MIESINLVVSSLTLLVVAVYPLYSALMARIMDNQLAEKEPRPDGTTMRYMSKSEEQVYRPDETQIIQSAVEQNEQMIRMIRRMISSLDWSIEKAETLLEEPDSELDEARGTLRDAVKNYGE